MRRRGQLLEIAALALALAAGLAAQMAAQIAKPRAAIAAAPVAVTRIPQPMLANLEKNFDARLESIDPEDPIDMLGGTRALYLPGYGTVFTTEISLIVTPGISPFRPKYSDALKAQIHRRKLSRVPQLEETMKNMMDVTARTVIQMPDDQKIVFAVRLRYLPEEDTTGLPSQIVMTADNKKAAQMGDIKTEVE